MAVIVVNKLWPDSVGVDAATAPVFANKIMANTNTHVRRYVIIRLMPIYLAKAMPIIPKRTNDYNYLIILYVLQ